jgi:hypothetical protein
VSFRGRQLKRVSLQPLAGQGKSRLHRRQIIPIATFPERTEGRVRIVSLQARPVRIEGLGVAAK